MHEVVFDDVTKAHPDGPPALDHFSASIGGGELFALVGPSGCGKTTALRIVAGLEPPSSGRVLFGGRDVTAVPTRDRGLGLVSQTNMLLDHRTAGANIRLPLEVGRRRHAGAKERVDSEAANLGIQHLLDRRPTTLSEGERRLVQLARAIIAEPSTLLLDEPLAFVEDQVRQRLRAEIRRVHRARSLTTILVTANQHDAMAMSDRIAVLFDGAVHQIGTPEDIYNRPATARVAAFFGEPPMNVVPAAVHVTGDDRRVELLGRSVRMWTPLLDAYDGRSVLIGFRPEDLVADGRTLDTVDVRVTATEPLGRETLAETITRDGTTISCKISGGQPAVGGMLELGLRVDRLHLFDPATEMAMIHPASLNGS